MLSAVKNYLHKRGVASLREIALHLNSPVDAVDGMLQTLLRKGVVREKTLKSACGTGCSNCDPATVRFFELVEGETHSNQMRPIDPPSDCPS